MAIPGTVRANRRFEMHFSHLVGVEAEPAELFVDVVGYSVSRGYYDYTQDARAVVLRIMLAGAGRADIAGRDIPLGADQLFVYWPGDPVRFTDTPASPWSFIFVALSGSAVPAALQRAGFPVGSRAYDLGSAGAAVRKAARELLRRFRRGDLGTLYPVSAAWQLLLVCSEASGLHSRLRHHGSVALACRELLRTDDAPRSIAAIASQLGVSRATLYRAFSATYAMSPKEYQEQVRFERACHLLCTTELSVVDIALRCHFNDPDYFSARFHQRFHAAPTAWRRVRRGMADGSVSG
jgi:AraC-like DNA-binding protein